VFDRVPVVNGTFAQSSLLLNRMLREVVDAALDEPESLLDLYCGSGNFSLPYTDRCAVVGVDVSGPAVMAALRASGADYRVGNEPAMRELLAARAWDTVLLDPPRAGAKKIVMALAGARCNRVVYVSCDPASLARDTRELLDAGWRAGAVTVVDMFPNTPHIETVCRFER
jgi:23S rRNA (uracil1939-C5)-methyltransferase